MINSLIQPKIKCLSHILEWNDVLKLLLTHLVRIPVSVFLNFFIKHLVNLVFYWRLFVFKDVKSLLLLFGFLAESFEFRGGWLEESFGSCSLAAQKSSLRHWFFGHVSLVSLVKSSHECLPKLR